MTAECIDDSVDNTKAALSLITNDLVSILIFWLSLLYIRHFVECTESDITGYSLSASDFTVLFLHTAKENRVEDMHTIYWEWAEYIIKS